MGARVQEQEPVVELDLSGRVKWYNRQKGFGFIKADDGRELFVHHTGLATKAYEELKENDPVSFDVADGRRGLKCVNVKVGI